MRKILPQEYDEVVVKKFALFPIWSKTTMYWLEHVYVLKRYLWNFRFRDCMWYESVTDYDDYCDYQQYVKNAGNKYRHGTPPTPPPPPNTGSGVRQ